ncbi:rRNA SAM-dependent methyltransferase [cyanobacterium endosymbiont of Rhopalodia gibberula]|uniref:16S rRNA (cytosine(967)-C(5))-methyltransferase n=1 Tax=cyanobacterium endosymbiont of Rhopalodia gibberula TaxID=1763363 RepID=UPI000DC6FA80|nr:16S rRNA (cytosine(967)-C(5))-methyltransferase [cyanobacterium endosymbiont of Rhopalodia gibberula]BBA78707.1 rRNA SAM-dependent methyltransferase [cyanobacterium endosymbiont of Rhopalodia gibberula]
MKISSEGSTNCRQLALLILKEIEQRGAYTDIVLDHAFNQTNFNPSDRALITELVYGIVRRRRTLDALIDQLGKKFAHQQPPNLRLILHLGLYQLRYLSHIPLSAAVNTSVDLAKENQLRPLSGVVNGILRNYIRLSETKIDPLTLPNHPVEKLGVLYSFPNEIIEPWLQQFGEDTTAQLCEWFNQPPHLDLRINPLTTTLETVEVHLKQADIKVMNLKDICQGLRLTGKIGAIKELPGFKEGWWTVQDSSAQLVTHLLDPQPSEVIIDACAAPGGKTTHIAELMQDQGIIFACDRTPSRLNKLQANAQRLHLKSIRIVAGDSRQFDQFTAMADRVLLDAPCSGLGTLHRHPDIRWRHNPEKVKKLSKLQQELLEKTATWVKPRGVLVYATCTLNCLENELIIKQFLDTHTTWYIEPPLPHSPLCNWVTSLGWIKILPHQHQMDGFFLVKLKKG